MGNNQIEIIDISKSYRSNGEEKKALLKTSMTIEQGRFISLIGPSGCGKSTLFNIMAGLLPPSGGDIKVNDKSILGQTGYVGYMLQRDMLLPWRTIMNNVILGLEIQGIPKKEAAKQAAPLMKKYGLGGYENNYPHELSGGMRQRAALLRTLLYDREIILLDEPFGALDAQTRLSMQNWLLQIWKDFKKTILFVTHDIDEAIYLSDEIYVFTGRPGYITEQIPVSMPRPRHTDDTTKQDFLQLKHHLIDLLSIEQAEDLVTNDNVLLGDM